MANRSKEKLKLRPALPSDEDWIKKIYAKNKINLGSFDLWSSWKDYIEKRKGQFTVINEIGFIRYAYMKKYFAYVVHEIGVTEECLGHGYGKLLLQSVPVPILLKCNKDNERGNAFYKAMKMDCAGLTATR